MNSSDKVWCVEFFNKQHFTMMAIFSTHELAREWIAARPKPNNYFVSEWLVDRKETEVFE